MRRRFTVPDGPRPKTTFVPNDTLPLSFDSFATPQWVHCWYSAAWHIRPMDRQFDQHFFSFLRPKSGRVIRSMTLLKIASDWEECSIRCCFFLCDNSSQLCVRSQSNAPNCACYSGIVVWRMHDPKIDLRRKSSLK